MISRRVTSANNVQIRYAADDVGSTAQLQICSMDKAANKRVWRSMLINFTYPKSRAADTYIPHAGHWLYLNDTGGETKPFSGNGPPDHRHVLTVRFNGNNEMCITKKTFTSSKLTTLVSPSHDIVLHQPIWKMLVADLRRVEHYNGFSPEQILRLLDPRRSMTTATLPQQLFGPRKATS